MTPKTCDGGFLTVAYNSPDWTSLRLVASKFKAKYDQIISAVLLIAL